MKKESFLLKPHQNFKPHKQKKDPFLHEKSAKNKNPLPVREKHAKSKAKNAKNSNPFR